ATPYDHALGNLFDVGLVGNGHGISKHDDVDRAKILGDVEPVANRVVRRLWICQEPEESREFALIELLREGPDDPFSVAGNGHVCSDDLVGDLAQELRHDRLSNRAAVVRLDHVRWRSLFLLLGITRVGLREIERNWIWHRSS